MTAAAKSTSNGSKEGPPQTFFGLKLNRRPPAYAQGRVVPEKQASIASQVLFEWITPLTLVGLSRPIEVDDVWVLPPELEATTLGLACERSFYARCPPSKRPRHLRDPRASSPSLPAAAADAHDDDPDSKDMGDIELGSPTISNMPGVIGAARPISAKEDKGKTGSLKKVQKGEGAGDLSDAKEARSLPKAEEAGKIYDQSLLRAINRVILWRSWSAGLLGLLGYTLGAVSPVVIEKLLGYIQISYAHAKGTSDVVPPSIGYGIGLAIALWAMQQVGTLAITHYYCRSMVCGFMARTMLISVVSRKSLRLSGEGRVKHTNGQLVTHISADASFLDWAALLAHELWIQPIQIAIGIAILITLLGPLALVGLAVLVLGVPLQGWLVMVLIGTRQAQMDITDRRVRLLNEILQGIRVIKLMAYERYFGGRVEEYRRQELKLLVKNCITRGVMIMSMSLTPVLAAVLSFITYALAGHDLSPSTIFAALAAFNNIRMPLSVLPYSFQTCSDAYVALIRISKAMLAQEIDHPIPVRPDAPYAISAHADYGWESVGPAGIDADAGDAPFEGDEGRASEDRDRPNLTKPAAPFQLRDIKIDIPRGAFVVICGKVGSGKSSLVQALIGEMKMLRGESYLGGSTAYFPQAPWVLNATLRDNILFGDTNVDEARFQEAVRSCALEPDIAMLTYGLETEIGERGINLSGGQKARVCLARAVYANTDICFLDDPLSAVDAHVSKTLVECLTTGPLAKQTRVLVTHHLEVLPQADLIITMLDGKVAEIGSYAELMAAEGALAKLVQEHVSDPHQAAEEADEINPKEEQEIKNEKIADERLAHDEADVVKTEKKVSTKSEGALMMKEEREVGAVTWAVYGRYISSMGGLWRMPLFLATLVLAQGANVGTTILLGKWSESGTPGLGVPGWSRSDYMATYAGLGLAYSLISFCGTVLLFLSGTRASYNLFNLALNKVMRSSVGWHDQTPVGRIVSRLSKDILVMDDELPGQWNQLLTMCLNVVGTVALVFYSFPYLGIIFIPLFVLYYAAARFYRATSREVKRVDANMRSFVYAAFGEMVTGIASVRAYHAEERFVIKTEKALDVQNRCYYMSVMLQGWLGARLDVLGNVLVLAIALFGIGFRETVSPSKLGVVLTYSLSLTMEFSQLVSDFADVEMSMNTTERVIHYTNLNSEAATHTKDDPPAEWPAKGEVVFDNVVLKYREELPPVLKGTTFSIKAGEKVGIVGRTGVGKSSLLQALFRIVELTSGTISIDGVNLATIGLDPIRQRLGIVPQDPLLWSGKVRDNLDPEGIHTEVELLEALRRCNLVAADHATVEVKARLQKFELEAIVQDEGSNFSAGERQLMALARVVVRNSRIIVLDEATSSVDVETDQLIQETIRTEFTDQTLITIAHRLSTISFYDRVIVMDAGIVLEIGPPLELFDTPGSSFRAMCDKASLSREDIIRIRR